MGPFIFENVSIDSMNVNFENERFVLKCSPQHCVSGRLALYRAVRLISENGPRATFMCEITSPEIIVQG